MTPPAVILSHTQMGENVGSAARAMKNFGLSELILIAPMMEWTDTHCRVLHRLLTRRALLYTEMVTAEAVLRGGGTLSITET